VLSGISDVTLPLWNLVAIGNLTSSPLALIVPKKEALIFISASLSFSRLPSLNAHVPFPESSPNIAECPALIASSYSCFASSFARNCGIISLPFITNFVS